MKLRYYLRGLGIGILVTALMLAIVPGEKETLSDAEIKNRALQLGMVDAGSLTLADMQGKIEQTNKEESKVADKTVESVQNEAVDNGGAENADSEAGNSEKENAGSEADSTKAESTEKKEDAESAEVESVGKETETAKNEDEEASEDKNESVKTEVVSENATITIKSGDSSYTVAKALKNAGLIEDAGAFDAYLCNNGYSRRIVTGTFIIANGTSMEEIAKIITGKR